MKKTNVFRTLGCVAVAALMLTSCNQTAQKPAQTAGAETTAPIELKLAYVETDSIMSQYQFWKDCSKILEQKSQNIQKTLAGKQQQLQNAAANFQQKIQQNAYTREEAQRIQASLEKQNNDLQVLSQRLGNEFQAETEKYNIALHDSISNFLAKYNKDKKYTLILSKAGDNILFADKALDITDEVVAGLNKAYKPTSAAKKEKAETAEEKPAAAATTTKKK